MAKVLLAWELGGGLGHVTVLRPVAEALRMLGHQVVLAARDTCVAERVFRGADIQIVQSPVKQGPVAKPFDPLRSFAHLLHHVGFENTDELCTLVASWKQLYESIRPDVTVFDHSPTALLASRCRKMRRVLIGTGFCAPPVGESLPDMRPWLPKDGARLAVDESRTLAIANQVLAQFGQPELRCLSGLYGQADENLLTTFPELDHFGPRDNATYWGIFQDCPDARPNWPCGRGPRVFAYLKRAPGLLKTIQVLGRSGHSTIMFAPWANDAIRAQFGFPNLRFSTEPLDLATVAQECDFAVLNGTHGATAQMLLAGKPILQLPIHLEQRLMAQRTAALGAALEVDPEETDDIAESLDNLANSSQFQASAEAFAKKYSAFDQGQRFEEMIARIDALAI